MLYNYDGRLATCYKFTHDVVSDPSNPYPESSCEGYLTLNVGYCIFHMFPSIFSFVSSSDISKKKSDMFGCM